MNKYYGLFIIFSLSLTGCESPPEKTIEDAAQHFERGLSGQGTLVERNWDEVTET